MINKEMPLSRFLQNLVILQFFLFSFQLCFAQETRIAQLKERIEMVIPDSPGLAEKVNINIKEATLGSFLLAISEVHKVNFSVAPSLNSISIVNNFSDVTVSDLLVFLCKEYQLTIDFTGNILSIKTYEKPIEKIEEKPIVASYDSYTDFLSLDLKGDQLYEVFKKLIDVSGKNMVFAPGLEQKTLTAYIQKMPFESALQKLAYANDLTVSKSKDGFFMFDQLDGGFTPEVTDKNLGVTRPQKPQRSRKSNFYFQVLDADKKRLDVDFENTSVASIIYDIGNELGVDMYIASPLESIGNATFKAKNISFDELLERLFESKSKGDGSSGIASVNSSSTNFSNDYSPQSEGSFAYKKNGSIYYFGLKNQLVVRHVKVIAMMHRSIDLLGNPSSEGRSSGRISHSNTYTSYDQNRQGNSTNQNFNVSNSNNSNPSGVSSTTGESILSIIPDEIRKELDIRIDKELNSFVVSGPAINIERFESFVKYIDKAVPVVLIEVMLLENSRSATVETGINAGIGDKPVATKGGVFPNADITLGADTINKIINNFDGFGSLNIGNVVPNFYLSLKALETNGNVKIRSTPRLSTLNGHKAYLSIGETTYYVVTNQNFYGSQIPQASEIRNYQPIDAELSVAIMPLVSGDGQITMDVKVVQSSFNGQKVDRNAPPGINSREFNSIIRVKDQDLVVLGGLEEKVKNDTGNGVPLLSRIPILKWVFSSRKREDSKKKLTVLIKPTVIY